MNWLTASSKQKIKAFFEPRYQRSLNDDEVISIADNLETVFEEILKLKWRQKYEKTI